MDTAAAVMQIKEVMNAPTAPVPVVLMRADGEAQEMTIDQRKVNELIGGVPTIVGGILSLNVFASGLRDQSKAAGPKNKHKFPETFDKDIRGDVVLFRTNEETSAPEPFTLKEFNEWVAAAPVQQSASKSKGKAKVTASPGSGPTKTIAKSRRPARA